MNLDNLWPLRLSIALLPLCLLAPPSFADAGDTLFPGAGANLSTPYDTQDVFGSGAPGLVDANGVPIGNTNQPVLGESHPGWGANQVNYGTNIPGPINDYPDWSTQTQRSAGNGPNQRHQFPVGVRGGLPQTTTRLIAPLNDQVQQTPSIGASNFEGRHTFGFKDEGDQQYLGVRANFKGLTPQSGGTLPSTSTGSVGLKVTEGDHLSQF